MGSKSISGFYLMASHSRCASSRMPRITVGIDIWSPYLGLLLGCAKLAFPSPSRNSHHMSLSPTKVFGVDEPVHGSLSVGLEALASAPC